LYSNGEDGGQTILPATGDCHNDEASSPYPTPCRRATENPTDCAPQKLDEVAVSRGYLV